MIIEATAYLNPGDIKSNGSNEPHARGGRLGFHKTKRYNSGRCAVALAVRLAREGRSFSSGPVCVTITLYWPRKRRKGPAAGLPLGDVDGPETAILNAITASGAWGDDGQVTKKHAVNRYDRTNPRIEIRIEEERET